MADKDAAEIAQITFFLAREEKNFAELIDSEADITNKSSYRKQIFKVGDIPCEFLFFEAHSERANPPWLDFVNEQVQPKEHFSFSGYSKSANGILLIKIKDRILAATFGRSATACLRKDRLEPDFGIKTAMNLCGNEEIRQTKSQSNTITTTHIDRQVAQPSDAFVFGLSEAEDLKYISAHVKGNKSITLQGRDSLTIKIVGEDKLTWDKLINQCDLFLRAYASTDYAALFPNYKNFKPATSEEIKSLDAILMNKLRSKDFEKLRLSIPEFISDDEFSFSYTNYPAKENIIYSHIDVSQLSNAVVLDEIDVEKLKAKKIYAYSSEDDRIIHNKRWAIYDCLVFEHELGGKYFILSDGRWVEVDDDFYKSIKNFIENRLHVEEPEKEFLSIAIGDDKVMKNKEAIFNEEVIKIRSSAVLFDRAKLRIGKGRKDKEFCDILDINDAGAIRIINCKPLKEASSINYLFSQAKFYCEAFLHDESFLADIRDHIAKSGSARTGDYLSRISDNIENIKGQDYVVCLWLLYDEREKSLPNHTKIPLIAQYELKLMHDHLRKTCKFSDIILRFIPVKMSGFSKKVKPKPKAA
ncbi:DUF6119 family protein [Rhizobium leguminosarum]|uniref:DUF6119 family protein n=1 Tax=Rhizobium leguminosarum TaxID=384 RepID=UPI0014413F58|nr:DUF6119 family protein [Rhizobium leguminosarum]MBY5868779.1 TIGR04141 family sporadically distributed protein [Rhizobium leguminosarum]NKM06207.1 hypothetical protein [Rhizobium leguminosarum bv. viciae]